MARAAPGAPRVGAVRHATRGPRRQQGRAVRVFDVHSRVGELEHSLETMDSCRVSWGPVTAVEGPVFVVERQPLHLVDGQLALGPAQPARIARQIGDRGFADRARVGDWLSIHWGWACDILSETQVRTLERYTLHHLRLANQTI